MKLSRLNPMNIGWFTAIAAALIVLPLLYFVEELRQSQVDLSKEPLSELTEEEKEVVRKKIKRPEPKPEQVEEIARQQKEKKEEEMRKNVRKLKQTVYEMEEAVEERKKPGTDRA
jgi:peptidoglycan hydrolase CwlO-like protein